MPDSRFSDADIVTKWSEFAAILDRLAERVNDPDEFPVLPGSSLSGDDRQVSPFEVSGAVRHLINASVDQLHAVKVLRVDARTEHLAVGHTLARAALENTATALWILGPDRRRERLERVLRWHARDATDAHSTIGHLGGDASSQKLDRIRATADRLNLDADSVIRGYAITKPIRGAASFTRMDVHFLWSVASGFAHGRPWAYDGLLHRRVIRMNGPNGIARLTPRTDLSIWLPLEALHLLSELLRLRDRRAGLAMPPLPDGTPDSTIKG